MKSWINKSKKSLLIGLLSLVLMFSLGHAGSMKSAHTTAKGTWKTESSYKHREVKGYPYSVARVSLATPHIICCYPFAELIQAHTQRILLHLKIGDRPITNDLFLSHRTSFKIAPTGEEYAKLIA